MNKTTKYIQNCVHSTHVVQKSSVRQVVQTRLLQQPHGVPPALLPLAGADGGAVADDGDLMITLLIILIIIIVIDNRNS